MLSISVPSGGEGERAAIFRQWPRASLCTEASGKRRSHGVGHVWFRCHGIPPTTRWSKVGEQTVTDPEFYRRFFALIDTFMP